MCLAISRRNMWSLYIMMKVQKSSLDCQISSAALSYSISIDQWIIIAPYFFLLSSFAFCIAWSIFLLCNIFLPSFFLPFLSFDCMYSLLSVAQIFSARVHLFIVNNCNNSQSGLFLSIFLSIFVIICNCLFFYLLFCIGLPVSIFSWFENYSFLKHFYWITFFLNKFSELQSLIIRNTNLAGFCHPIVTFCKSWFIFSSRT